MNPADIIIKIEEEKLSDGSVVCNVIIRDQTLARTIKVPAVTSRDADKLADKIRDAFNSHTVFAAEIR